MNDFINTLQSVLESKGFIYSVAVLLTVIITEIVKKPLKRKILFATAKENKPANTLTFYLSFIPLGIGVVFIFIYYSWIDISWNFSSFSYASFFSELGTFYAMSQGVYIMLENVVKKIKSDAVSNNKDSEIVKDVKKPVDNDPD